MLEPWPTALRDMEAIDPDVVEVPDWYEANPGLAGELALVLITGDAERQGKSRITNRRWATSAYGDGHCLRADAE